MVFVKYYKFILFPRDMQKDGDRRHRQPPSVEGEYVLISRVLHGSLFVCGERLAVLGDEVEEVLRNWTEVVLGLVEVASVRGDVLCPVVV